MSAKRARIRPFCPFWISASRASITWRNYLAAISAVWGEVPVDVIKAYARGFRRRRPPLRAGARARRCRWYNDSIGSSPSRTIAGLNAFEKPVILIAGGYDKHIPYAPLGPVAAKTVKAAILMGATADAIEAAIRAHADLPIYRVYNMEEAVPKSCRDSRTRRHRLYVTSQRQLRHVSKF